MKKVGDGQVQELSAYFLRNKDFWRHMRLQGSQFDAEDFALCLHFEDHVLNDPDSGTLGNYFVGSRRERVPNNAVNNTASSRGAMIFDAPGRWHGIEALPGLQLFQV